MQNIKYYLFRLVLEPIFSEKTSSNSRINTLFDSNEISRSKIIEKIILFSPKLNEEDSIYIIANPKTIDGIGVYFKFGSIRKQEGVTYDKTKNDFLYSKKDEADYVQCYYKTKEQILAIENKPRFYSISGITKRLEDTLESIKQNKQFQLTKEENAFLNVHTCKTRKIYKSVEFIKSIRDAQIVSNFTIIIPQKNPQDFGDMIGEPLSNLLEETGGKFGKLTVHNNGGLKKDRLEKLSRDAGAYGAGASATIQKKHEEKCQTIKLDVNRNHAYCSISQSASKEETLKQIYNTYKEIHYGEDK